MCVVMVCLVSLFVGNLTRCDMLTLTSICGNLTIPCSVYCYSSDFELPKFPRRQRRLIMREIGKSSMTKTSMFKRQKLLEFALKNMVRVLWCCCVTPCNTKILMTTFIIINGIYNLREEPFLVNVIQKDSVKLRLWLGFDPDFTLNRNLMWVRQLTRTCWWTSVVYGVDWPRNRYVCNLSAGEVILLKHIET